MQIPKVSIIIPVFNGSNYLKESIDSAINQDCSNIEVIVVNDGSNDNGKTETIAKSYGKKIRYFYKENSGVSSALNFGIKRMTGDWFSWLSHDDVYLKDKISSQISVYLRNPNVKFIFSDLIFIDEYGKKLNHAYNSWTPNKKIPQIRQLLCVNKINGCTVLIKRECFKKSGFFNEDNKTSQDYEMWLKLSVYFDFYHHKKIVLKSRIHKNMGTITLAKRSQQDIRNALKLIDSKFSIDQFFPEILSNSSSSNLLRNCHLKLGDIYLTNHGLTNLAKKHYWIAFSGVKFNQMLIKLRVNRLFFSYKIKKYFCHNYNAVGWEIFKSIFIQKMRSFLKK